MSGQLYQRLVVDLKFAAENASLGNASKFWNFYGKIKRERQI